MPEDLSKFPRPSVAADIAVFCYRDNKLHILLVQRKNDPHKGKWVLPGGFCEQGESVEQTACRELLEETGIGDIVPTQTRLYSAPGRDPRGWIMSAAHMAFIPPDRMGEVKAGDDAADAQWWEVVENTNQNDSSLSYQRNGVTIYSLAFDHDQMVLDTMALVHKSYDQRQHPTVEVVGTQSIQIFGQEALTMRSTVTVKRTTYYDDEGVKNGVLLKMCEARGHEVELYLPKDGAITLARQLIATGSR